MKTLLLDNHDSFSHILFQYLWEVNGEEPLFVRNDEWTLERIRSARFDTILISPGPGRPDNPADFGVCGPVIAAFPDVPILGVCLGHQGLGLAAGAEVVAAPRVRHGKVSRILHGGGGLFAGLPQGFPAMRYHSLVIRPDRLPPGLEVLATAEDDGQIMALRLAKRPGYGVQFHPESVGTEGGKALLANFRDLARDFLGTRGGRAGAAEPCLRPESLPASVTPVAPAPPAAANPDSTRSAASPDASPGPHAVELPWRDPESVFAALFRSEPAAFWLDSLAAPVPGEPLVTYMGSGARVLEAGREGVRAYSVLAPGPAPAFQPADPFAWLAGQLGGGVPRELPKGDGRAAGGFRGGLVGWLGYELKRHAGGGDLPGTPASDLPDALLLEPARMLVFDHAAGKARACLPETEGGPSDADRAWLASLPGRWPTLPELPPLALEAPAVPAPPGLADIRLPFALSAPAGTYLASIRSLQEAIHRGESYEACLTNEVRVEAGADPFLVYRVLRRANPSPYAAYARFPQAAVLSASPERFLKLDAAGRLACRPIKGTRPRGRDAAEDAAIRAELAGNPKDRSENLMIVDLVRNDFGRVCALGTVEVRESLVVEEHPTVFQLVSGVEGRPRPGVSAPEAVRACFPGGSMTGAPKKRAMELLEALERRPRGIFSGALGWLGRDGAMDLGMVIRTLVRVPIEGAAGAGGRGEYRVGCGGAILAESCPEAELAEALLKAAAPLRALELAESGQSGGWTLRG